jgi:hypothetical protein
MPRRPNDVGEAESWPAEKLRFTEVRLSDPVPRRPAR